jgi:hypothetical protein
MKRNYFFTLCFIASLLCITSCAEKEEILYGVVAPQDCKVMPPFVSKLGFNPNTCAFTTSERKYTGICLADFNVQPVKIYQDSTWREKGNLGPIAIDEVGNVYVVPIPFVNVLDVVRKDQNVIYKLDPNTGVLAEFFSLSNSAKKLNLENVYGFVGLVYDCESKLLYASSIAESTREEEKGIIYCINPATSPAKVLFKLENVDAMGIGIAIFNEKKHLFYGSTRDHNIYRVQLQENGDFMGEAKNCFSLMGIGPRGDDVAKKIRFDSQNRMLLTGLDFHYTLTAPTQVQESKYIFNFNVNDGKWIISN